MPKNSYEVKSFDIARRYIQEGYYSLSEIKSIYESMECSSKMRNKELIKDVEGVIIAPSNNPR